MAATYRSSTSTTTGATPAGSLTITVPSGVQVGDLLLASIATEGGTGASISSAPAGWTLLSNVTQSTNVRLITYCRIATGYEAVNYTWNLDTARQASALMAAYSGCYQYLPYAASTALTSSPSTSLTGAGPNSTYTGRTVHIVAAYNTSAASTINPAGGYTKREEACTTASAYIDVAIQDSIPKGYPLGGTNNANSTCTQSVTGVVLGLFLEDSHPSFNVMDDDTAIVGSFTTSRTSITTTAFQINYYNTLLVGFFGIHKDAATVSSITGFGLTWTLVARANANAGSSEIWRTFVRAPLNNVQFTINYSSSVVSGNFMIAAIVGADISGTGGSGAIGATNTAATTAAPASVSLTTTRNNSWVWAVANEGQAAAPTITAGTNQTSVRTNSDATNASASWVLRQNALTATSGTSVTMNSTSPSSNDCNIAAVEILPKPRQQLGLLGVG